MEAAGGVQPPAASAHGAVAMLDLGDNAGCAGTGAPISGGAPGADGFALASEPPQDRSVGRPAGSRNVRDMKLVQLIESKHGSPLQALAQLYERASDPVKMWMDIQRDAKAQKIEADDIGLTIKDCIDLAIKAAIAALPYMVKKQPVAVEVQSDAQAVTFNITIGQTPVALTQDRAQRILDAEEIEDAEILAAIAATEPVEVGA